MGELILGLQATNISATGQEDTHDVILKHLPLKNWALLLIYPTKYGNKASPLNDASYVQ